ncbi:MAG: exonuclease subunit SbcD [bacterium]|nr:exonuclease subunit SbcD [bacterium]
MRVLHTSDWHLGIDFYEHSRNEEFEKFFGWLLETIEREKIDALVVAGDIFDGYHPSNASQKLYYNFFAKLPQTGCSNAVIISGNHDSREQLEAPKALLESLGKQGLGVWIIARKPDNLRQEVLVLKDRSGEAQLIVAAVPYLRPGDIEAGHLASEASTVEEMHERYLQGYKEHYAAVKQEVERARLEHGGILPAIYMGHMSLAGCQLTDKMRDIPVGNLDSLTCLDLEDSADYVALGHLHIAQTVGGQDNWRYSGSPLHFSKSELRNDGIGGLKVSTSGGKSVVIVDFEGRKLREIRTLDIPVYRDIRLLESDEPEKAIEELKNWAKENQVIWAMVDYSGPIDMRYNLYNELKQAIKGSKVDILWFRNQRWNKMLLSADESKLENEYGELTPANVFTEFIKQRCAAVSEDERRWIKEQCLSLYNELENSVVG